MAVAGDRVQVPSTKVGQVPRDGVVVSVTNGLLRVKWSGGEESTIMPSMGSLVVVGKVKSRTVKAGVAAAPKGGASRGRKGTASASTKSVGATKSGTSPRGKGSPKAPTDGNKRRK